MKAMRKITMGITGWSLLAILSLSGWSQPTPTPQPTPVPFNPGCMMDEPDPDTNLISNGGLTEGILVSGFPPEIGWLPGMNTAVLQKSSSGGQDNYFLEFSEPGASISTVPESDTATRFDLTFCAVIPAGGQLSILINGNLIANVPSIAGEAFIGQFKKTSIIINLGSGASQNEKTIEFVYEGNDSAGPAYIDNILLLPSTISGGDEETPTPTVPEPTPTAEPEGPTPTPTPTVQPGIPTPTPTPAVTTHSVQMNANPPMLLISPDDFITSMGGGARKQVALDFQVVGSTGEKMDVLSIDPDATVRFLVDTRGEAEGVGYVEGFDVESQNWRSLTNQRIDLSRFKNTYQERAYFIPSKPYTGTVRVIVEIEYDGWANGREETRKLRGVVPIVLQVDKSASLTHVTGTFNPTQNMSIGKKPGDRGFRPDARTNLFFRERMK